MIRTASFAAAVCVYLAFYSVALAQPKLPFGPTAQEMLALPEECQGILGGDPAKKAYYEQLLPGLVGPNHYCWGLNFMNRARFSTDKIEKRFNLESAIGEFGYVLKHSAPNANGLSQIKAQQDLAVAMLKML